MKVLPNNTWRSMCLVLCTALLFSCASGGKKTEYYGLFSYAPEQEVVTYALSAKAISFGVNPIVLPSYLEHSGIVSFAGHQRILVSGGSAWAGDLDKMINRVVANNVGRHLPAAVVKPFPWNRRLPPQYKIESAIHALGGERGGNVRLQASWSLLNQKGTEEITSGTVSAQEKTEGNSAGAYVRAYNRLLNGLSESIAADIAKALK